MISSSTRDFAAETASCNVAYSETRCLRETSLIASEPLSTAVHPVDHMCEFATVISRDGKTCKVKSVICIVPLNVLLSLKVLPGLSIDKRKAIQNVPVNSCNQVHLDINGSDYVSWTSIRTCG